MRTHIKQKILEICDTIFLIHNEIIKIGDLTQQISYLGMAEEVATAILHTLENEPDDYKAQEELLHQYCTALYEISKKEEIVFDDIQTVHTLFELFFEFVDDLSPVLEVVFFPYQYMLWDSLESIYTAFKKQDNCRVSIVPIPYSEYQAKDDSWKACYTGTQFTEYDIVHYLDYDIEKMTPDIAFIHNPYDEFNSITRVDETYYSYNLKKHVSTLVYVAYAMRSTELQLQKLNFSAHHHCDYLIYQSKQHKENFKLTEFYDKVLPFGSPKIDSCVVACKNHGVLPPIWKEALEGKKIIQLSLTLTALLKKREGLFQKYQEIFKQASEVGGIAFIFRPHPLLKTVISASLPELTSSYKEMMSQFQKLNIGVYDDSQPIENDIALCDAYMDNRQKSSVMDLVAVVGKPGFLFDDFLSLSDMEKRNIFSMHVIEEAGRLFGISHLQDGVFEIDTDFSNIHYLGMTNTKNQATIGPLHGAICNNAFYSVYPENTQLTKFDLDTKKTEILSTTKGNFRFVLVHNETLFYIPRTDATIAIYDTKTEKWAYDAVCLSKFIEKRDAAILSNYYMDQANTVQHFVVVGHTLYLCAIYTNDVIAFDMEKKTYTTHEIGNQNNAFTSMVCHQNKLYLGDISGDIIEWDFKNKIKTIKKPKDLLQWQWLIGNTDFAYLNLFSMGNCLIAIPAMAGGIVKIDTAQATAKTMLTDIFKNDLSSGNGYVMGQHAIGNYGHKIDDTTLVLQSTKSFETVKIDVVNETYERIFQEISDSDYEAFLSDLQKECHGFGKLRNQTVFYKGESRYSSMIDFFKEVLNEELDDIKPVQRAVIETLAENIDGTCGEKTCQFLLEEQW